MHEIGIVIDDHQLPLTFKFSHINSFFFLEHSEELDQMHVLQDAGRQIKAIYGTTSTTYNIASPALATHQNQVVMRPNQLWTVPFQQAVIVQLQHVKTEERELVWIPTAKPQPFDFELSNWAINHNNLMENPEDFRSPPFCAFVRCSSQKWLMTCTARCCMALTSSTVHSMAAGIELYTTFPLLWSRSSSKSPSKQPRRLSR